MAHNKLRTGRLSGRREMKKLLRKKGLHTVCEESRCPNMTECFERGVATFLILGDRCTRNCRFCAVEKGETGRNNPDEINNMVLAAGELDLQYVVVTSVTRDDLPDGGARMFAEAVQLLRREYPKIGIELLVPDFGYNTDALDIVLDAKPDVLGHNLETVEGLYPRIRPKSNYRNSLKLLKYAAQRSGMVAKTGIMLGLGETRDETLRLIDDAVSAGAQLLTIGQYFQPDLSLAPVVEYRSEQTFRFYAEEGKKRGLRHVESGARVRSSYRADEYGLV